MPNGVVHVGAHCGEEVSRYLAEGRDPIICFEPQSLTWNNPESVTLVRSALGDCDGVMVFHIPHHLHVTKDRDTQSGSGFRVIPEAARGIGWTPTSVDFTEVQVMRFDTWAGVTGFDPKSCSLLVVDVQGMELQVFKGFGDLLDGFKEVVVECSDPPVYQGGASAREIVEFFAQKKFTQLSPILRHGDVRFGKEE